MSEDTIANPTLWFPSEERIKNSEMYSFIKTINSKNQLDIKSFDDLHKWSINKKSDFWSNVWDYFNIIGTKGNEPYIDPLNDMPNSKFFPNGKVNYAENMLSGNNEGLAIVFKSEDKIRKELTWKDLKIQVATMASFLKNNGVSKGDRIAAFMPNMPETVIKIGRAHV